MDANPTQAGRASRRHTRRVVRLRRWLLTGVVLLAAVLAGLFWYARYRAHRFLVDIPRRLGLDIQSETNGFTLSQSSKGRTLFTVHAAKAIQRGNGKTTLHDVAITLFGPKGSNRTDSMRGDEFEYDQTNGVVRTAGEVYLDLAAPAASGTAPKPGAQRIQVTAHGMVFLQKLGVAATDEPLEIIYGGLHGGSVGADYESDTGVLRLRRGVHLEGTENGHAIHLVAAHAEMERLSQLATLEAATVAMDGSRIVGDHMKLTLAKVQVQRAEAEGHVSLDGERGVHMEASRMHGAFSAAGKPELITAEGGVKLREGSDSASASTAVLHLDAAGTPLQADLQGAVQVSAPRPDGTHTDLKTGRLVAQLVQSGDHTEMRDAVASEGAELRLVERVAAQPAGQGAGAQRRATSRTTVITAAMLHATSRLADGARYIDALHGEGNTRVEQTDDLGNRSVSSGDTLQANLLAPSKGKKPNASGLLRSATQLGHVVITQHRVGDPTAATGKGSPADTGSDTRGVAQRAEYTADSDRLELSGAPMVSSPELQVQADRITLKRTTGNADAEGSVRGVLLQKGAATSEPIHVLAEHATVTSTTDTARFSGSRSLVRLWTSTAQLTAPEVSLDKAAGTLTATSSASGPQTPVRLTLVQQPKAAAGKAARGGNVQVTARELLLHDANGTEPARLDMAGEVHIMTPDSSVTAERAVARLKPPSAKSTTSAVEARGTTVLGGGSSIDSILATGDVHLQQPGRSGTGERLLYTESDNRYELTGTPAKPPAIQDSLRGSLTGTTLIFHGADDSVEVTGEQGRRVHTETHAQPLRKR